MKLLSPLIAMAAFLASGLAFSDDCAVDVKCPSLKIEMRVVEGEYDWLVSGVKDAALAETQPQEVKANGAMANCGGTYQGKPFVIGSDFYGKLKDCKIKDGGFTCKKKVCGGARHPEQAQPQKVAAPAGGNKVN